MNRSNSKSSLSSPSIAAAATTTTAAGSGTVLNNDTATVTTNSTGSGINLVSRKRSRSISTTDTSNNNTNSTNNGKSIDTDATTSNNSLTTSAAEAKSGFQQFTLSINAAADELLHQIIPQRIIELEQLQRTLPDFKQSIIIPTINSSNSSNSSSTVPVVAPITSPIQSNSSIQSLSPILKSTIQSLLQTLNTIKLSIQLAIPTVSDGDNHGVEIQQECIDELNRLEESGYNMLDRYLNYTMNRSRLASKLIKYPGIIDYYYSIGELDSQQYTELLLNLLELRNAYTAIHDLLIKNNERIKDPRSEKHKHLQSMV